MSVIRNPLIADVANVHSTTDQRPRTSPNNQKRTTPRGLGADDTENSFCVLLRCLTLWSLELKPWSFYSAHWSSFGPCRPFIVYHSSFIVCHPAYTPMSSFHNSGFSRIKRHIISMQCESCSTSTFTPRCSILLPHEGLIFADNDMRNSIQQNRAAAHRTRRQRGVQHALPIDLGRLPTGIFQGFHFPGRWRSPFARGGCVHGQ